MDLKHFDAAATAGALPFERLIPALRTMFATGCSVPKRHVHEVRAGGELQFTSLIMPAWLDGRYYGVKTINIAPGNAARGLPGLHASYLLYDGATGLPLALIDGDQITARRTAAASALAAACLARPDAQRLLIVGAGRIAGLLADAYRVVRPQLRHIGVWARSSAQAQQLVDGLFQRGIDAVVQPDLAAAVQQADIVSCATLATEPVIQGRWLKPGSHLDLIGSFTPTMREADDDCFVGASLFVDTEEALQKSGDLLGPLSRDVIQASSLGGTLATLVRGTSTGRHHPDQRTVFKAVGTALEDLAAAMLVFEGQASGG